MKLGYRKIDSRRRSGRGERFRCAGCSSPSFGPWEVLPVSTCSSHHDSKVWVASCPVLSSPSSQDPIDTSSPSHIHPNPVDATQTQSQSFDSPFKALMTKDEADGTTATVACRFWMVSWTVTRRPFQSPVALAISSPIFFGD